MDTLSSFVNTTDPLSDPLSDSDCIFYNLGSGIRVCLVLDEHAFKLIFDNCITLLLVVGQQQVLADDGIRSQHLARGQAREPLERQPVQDLVGGHIDAVRAPGKVHVFLAQQLFNDDGPSIRRLGADEGAAQHGHLFRNELLVEPAVVLAQELVLVGVVAGDQRLQVRNVLLHDGALLGAAHERAVGEERRSRGRGVARHELAGKHGFPGALQQTTENRFQVPEADEGGGHGYAAVLVQHFGHGEVP